MRERSRAARLGRCFLVAALALVPLAAEAADVAAMKVFGLGLGDDRSAVAEAFPNMVFEPVDYADPVVGYTYEAALGRRAVERLEGRGFRPVAGRSPTEFVLRLTGDGRLYELTAWERFDRPLDCAGKIRVWLETYGAPDVQVLDEQVQWIERDIGVAGHTLLAGRAGGLAADRCPRAGRLAGGPARTPAPLRRAGGDPGPVALAPQMIDAAPLRPPTPFRDRE